MPLLLHRLRQQEAGDSQGQPAFSLMPMSAPCPCRQPGCQVLVRDGSGWCTTHRKQQRKQVDLRRESSAKRGYGYKWQQASEGFRRKHPLCECADCMGADPMQVTQVVDHIKPHRLDEAIASGDPVAIAKARALFWDRNNWCAMSKLHHDRKTALQDGGFGRRGAGQILQDEDG